MRTIKLALLTLAATLTMNAANADEAKKRDTAGKMDVIVVTATRPDPIETPALTALEQSAPTIDFTELTIEIPSLDPAEAESARIELALHDEPQPQS